MTQSQATPLRVGRPEVSEFAPFYAGYIARVTEEPLVALEKQAGETAAILRRIPESSAGYRYADGKWTVRDMVGHMADTERIFAYRALRIARGDTTPLPGFDERAYANAAGASARPWPDLVQDLATVRAASVALFRSFDADAWHRSGIANGAAISVRALGHIIVGHERHHLHVLQTLYKLPPS